MINFRIRTYVPNEEGKIMDVGQKLAILTEAAKYDVSCSSSGTAGRSGGKLGSALPAGCCHAFAADGRCISLLKILLSNACVYDCKYCLNRRSADFPRATFEPRELADLTIEFYRRNYIEGLFLSSAVFGSPDRTCERMIEVLRILREEYGFTGYIHAKAIPGASDGLLQRLGLLADRMSVNIELPSRQSLGLLAPDKTKESIVHPMTLLRNGITENREDLVKYRAAPQFVPAGQSTQMIVGASPESDYHILTLSEKLYQNYSLKRVYFSAYTPVVEDSLLPSVDSKPPLLREHRLYQADWLLRFYGFQASEILSPERPMLYSEIDPKCGWVLRNMDDFPVEVNTADYEMLLRVPGIGVTSAKRILRERRQHSLDFEMLKRIGVVLKRARFFLICNGRAMQTLPETPEQALEWLVGPQNSPFLPDYEPEQLSLFQSSILQEEALPCLKGEL